nr:aminoacyl-histidine dipeptidase [Sedimentibacter sp.]
MDLKNIQPEKVFHWFYELNQIPRCSGEEKGVSDFLVSFARERNLEVYQDEVFNVIIKKPATKGYEKSDTVIIQGHMDMVCIKGKGSNHDFKKDPIEMIVEGDIMRADNTTLGGDNGIAVAYGLAVLDSKDIKHPPIEVLVTTSEETGMDGVHALSNEHISGKILLNIDSEEEGVFLVSCAGGANMLTTFKLEKQKKSGNGLKIKISGLRGGHSGMEIIKQRANAIKLMGRILSECNNNADIRLSEIQGGTKHNAIPSEAKATILADDLNMAKECIDKQVINFKEEYRVEDNGLTIEVEEIKIKDVYTKKLNDELIDYMMMVPDGVYYMSKDIDGLVQASLNNAVIEEKDNNIVITTSVRSASDSSLREIISVLSIIARRTNAKTEEKGSYPAWQFDQNSKIREKAVKVYGELFGKEAVVSAIHAGLECGLLKEILPNTDMISFGPNLYDVHTEKEHLSISSVERVWKFLIKLLEDLK